MTELTREEREAKLRELAAQMDALLAEEEGEIVAGKAQAELLAARERNNGWKPVERPKPPSIPRAALIPAPDWPERQPQQAGDWPRCPRCRALGGVDPGCHKCSGTGYVCPRCLGDAYVYNEAGRVVPCGFCEVAFRRERDKLRSVSGLRGRLLECTFENFDASKAGVAESYRQALHWSGAPSYWLTIYGAPGNGKSHLAAAAANRLIDAGRAVEYVTVPGLLAYLKAAFDRSERDTAQERMERLVNIPVLILDDLGAENRTDWAEAELFNLLNGRSVLALPTMITTNLPPEKMAFRIKSRVSAGVIVCNRGQDYRPHLARQP